MRRTEVGTTEPASGGRSDAASTLGAALAAAAGLLLVILMWRTAYRYRDESGEGTALALAVFTTALVVESSIPLAATTAGRTAARPLHRWLSAALVIVTSAAGAAWVDAAVHG